jgi:archaeal flagellin N-terminal-like domain
MLTRNMSKSKKAISPILATLLLIVIAVAAIVVTYAWLMTYMSSAGEQAGVFLKKDASDFLSRRQRHGQKWTPFQLQLEPNNYQD